MLITSSYVGTSRGKTRCLFFLLYEDYIEAQAGLGAELHNEMERFARNMGEFGAVVVPFAGDAERVHAHVLDKPWPAPAEQCIRPTPALLMIDKDFNEFDPRKHQWIVFHLDDDESSAGKFRSLMQKLIEALPDQQADPFKVIRDAQREEEISKAANMIELKPGLFGISIDLKNGWKSLKTYLRERKTSSAKVS